MRSRCSVGETIPSPFVRLTLTIPTAFFTAPALPEVEAEERKPAPSTCRSGRASSRGAVQTWTSGNLSPGPSIGAEPTVGRPPRRRTAGLRPARASASSLAGSRSRARSRLGTPRRPKRYPRRRCRGHLGSRAGDGARARRARRARAPCPRRGRSPRVADRGSSRRRPRAGAFRRHVASAAVPFPSRARRACRSSYRSRMRMPSQAVSRSRARCRRQGSVGTGGHGDDSRSAGRR